MKKTNVDVFKILIIILLAWIGYSIHKYSQNGRYNMVIREEGGKIIIDSTTGIAYGLRSFAGVPYQFKKGFE